MILLLGSGYIAQAFAKEMGKRGKDFLMLRRSIRDYTDPNEFCRILDEGGSHVELVINAAAYIPHESVSLCDHHQAETIKGNVLLPTNLARVCELFHVPLAHISTACLWNDGKEHFEEDPPQRAFNGYCGFYVGCKVLAEEEVRRYGQHYIWRVRLPFDQFDSDRNYLSKLATFKEVWDQNNSCSHRGDFVKACLDLHQLKATWGTYNVVNPGFLNAEKVLLHMVDCQLVKEMPRIARDKTQGQCFVSCHKLLKAGVKMRPVREALESSLTNWISRG